MRMVYQISKHTVYLSIDTPQSIVYTIPRGAAYTKRQAVIVPRKRGDAYGFYQCYLSVTDSIVLSHFAQTKIAASAQLLRLSLLLNI